MRSPYPLQWPAHWPRSKSQTSSVFKTDQDKAMRHLHDELRLLGATDVVVTSNHGSGGDSGIAVYFFWRNREHVVACDKYWYKKDNLRACGLTIEGIRGMVRWGTSALLERLMSGLDLKQLPASTDFVMTWRHILNVSESASLDVARSAYRAQAKKLHPDAGGSEHAIRELNWAIEEAEKELGK